MGTFTARVFDSLTREQEDAVLVVLNAIDEIAVAGGEVVVTSDPTGSPDGGPWWSFQLLTDVEPGTRRGAHVGQAAGERIDIVARHAEAALGMDQRCTS